MLSPKDIANHNFQSVSRNAYRASDVDAFMEEVKKSYYQMFYENGEIVKKMGLLADRLTEYKNDSDNIRNALVTAERMKEEIVNEAQNKAQGVLKDAENMAQSALEAVNLKKSEVLERAQQNADKIVSDATVRSNLILSESKEDAAKLLAKTQKIYEDQMGTIQEDCKREKEKLRILKESSEQLKKTLKELYTRQISIIEEIPEFDIEHGEETSASPIDRFASDEYKEIIQEIVTDAKTQAEILPQALDDLSESVDEYINDEYSADQELDAVKSGVRIDNVKLDVDVNSVEEDEDVKTMKNFFSSTREEG
ncbi:MAG: DivIVA domain-containing protein [Oscillospiraceae bacterium]|nr:DivIVA domain-containing protein [Oscillospiraceae bacterium]